MVNRNFLSMLHCDPSVKNLLAESHDARHGMLSADGDGAASSFHRRPFAESHDARHGFPYSASPSLFVGVVESFVVVVAVVRRQGGAGAARPAFAETHDAGHGFFAESKKYFMLLMIIFLAEITCNNYMAFWNAIEATLRKNSSQCNIKENDNFRRNEFMIL
uniref:Uncharacterized protein n=1 Tax=Romanomermis culicivorax TaxID=13658 RepID=A0A915JGC1_ROMCU